MIPKLRADFNRQFSAEKYSALLEQMCSKCGTNVQFRVAETPVFVPESLLEEMAAEGGMLVAKLLNDAEYLQAAAGAIPTGYRVAQTTPHPNFLTADFALVQDAQGELVPRLVEIQAFPSVFGFQQTLCSEYREVFGLAENLGTFLTGLDEQRYWELLKRTILGNHAPENVVLTEVDPLHQKTLPDFNVTAERLGIAVVDIARVEAQGNTLYYRNERGQTVPIRRIYNRAIADELMARKIGLRFDLEHPWDVEWAGHPNWYFLISKFSIPWLSRQGRVGQVVPPAVFLSDFLGGSGREDLERAGVNLSGDRGCETVFSELLLKPLFSFAGKGIEFEPSLSRIETIPREERKNYLLQQRMRFVPTIETPHGLTQAEFRILYLWPDGGNLTPALSLVRLGRGKMMGVDHNKNQEWVGASAAFFPI